MSAQDAKRRRVDSTTGALSTPFRSPFRATSTKPNGDSQKQPGGFLGKQSNKTIPRCKVPNTLSVERTPSLFKRQRDTKLPRFTKALGACLEISSLVNAQRQLKHKLHCLTEELRLMEQAHKIENSPLDTRHKDGEVDGELLDLTEAWKAASRQAAEELFGSAKDRINRYAVQY